jgi:uncharacterized protein
MNNPQPINDQEPRPVPACDSEALGGNPLEPPALPPPPNSQLPAAAADHEVFWGYTDLCLFVFFALLGMLAGALVVKIEAAVFHFTKAPVWALLPAQMVTYAVLFGGIQLVFRVAYDRPFWRSLGWNATGLAAPRIVMAGMTTAMTVILAGSLIHLPGGANPMTELLQGRVAFVLMAAFGVGVAPLCEELAFRGFLQPLLVRSLGAVAGILIAGAAFGLLHYQEYGNSWRHALLICGAGVSFGCMRHFTRSTKAAVIMHASYNGLLFLLLSFSFFVERNSHH